MTEASYDGSLAFTLETNKLHPNYTIPMILHCPQCGERHIDEEAFAEVAHHTHACQGCGFVWRPAKVNTHGVRFLPGYVNESPAPLDPREGSVKFVRDCDNPSAPPVCYEFRDGAWRNRDGWIDWQGGECPVLDCVRVDVRFRGGHVAENHDPAGWDWHHHDFDIPGGRSGRDIVAYRVCDAPA